MRKPITVLKSTQDNWHGNLKLHAGTDKEVKLVEVSLRKLKEHDDWRIHVKGTDDYAMNMDFHNYSTALNTFNHVLTLEYVDIMELRTIGFAVH